jgi:hypothetical protein
MLDEGHIGDQGEPPREVRAELAESSGMYRKDLRTGAMRLLGR